MKPATGKVRLTHKELWMENNWENPNIYSKYFVDDVIEISVISGGVDKYGEVADGDTVISSREWKYFEPVVEGNEENLVPHKHQDLIVAWASGRDIEESSGSAIIWFISPNPTWDINKHYRVKPNNAELIIEKQGELEILASKTKLLEEEIKQLEG